MAKQSPAKVKKLAAEAKRAGAAQRAEKKSKKQLELSSNESPIDIYSAVDEVWREIGLAAPARRALIEDGRFQISDLRKTSLASLRELHGMGPNALRILIGEMKKIDATFRK